MIKKRKPKITVLTLDKAKEWLNKIIAIRGMK